MRFTNKDIIKDTNKLIREKSELVSFPLSKEDKSIIDRLHQYVVESTDDELCEKYDLAPAVGIAAVQVGILKRMCVVYIEDIDGEIICDLKLINPKIVSYTVEKTYLSSGEGCLSIDEPYEGYIHRYNKIKVRYQDYDGNKKEVELEGFPSIAVQHEIDHLNGILFYDHINKTNPYEIVENSKALEL